MALLSGSLVRKRSVYPCGYLPESSLRIHSYYHGATMRAAQSVAPRAENCDGVAFSDPRLREFRCRRCCRRSRARSGAHRMCPLERPSGRPPRRRPYGYPRIRRSHPIAPLRSLRTSGRTRRASALFLAHRSADGFSVQGVADVEQSLRRLGPAHDLHRGSRRW